MKAQQTYESVEWVDVELNINILLLIWINYMICKRDYFTLIGAGPLEDISIPQLNWFILLLQWKLPRGGSGRSEPANDGVLRYSQHNEDSTAPIDETSTNTTCRRPSRKHEEILQRLFWGSAGLSAAFPGICFGCPRQSWRWSLEYCNFFVYKIPDFVIIVYL